VVEGKGGEWERRRMGEGRMGVGENG